MEEPLTPREFLHRYSLPQLVRIHNAHRHHLDSNSASVPTLSKCSTLNRMRSSVDSMQSSSSSTTITSLTINQHYNDSNDSGHNTDTYSKKSPRSLPRKHILELPSEHDGNVSNQHNNNNKLDLDQPFLLYKAYTSRHIVAHTMSTDGSFDPDYFKPSGPALLIPDSYPGWFSLVNRKGHTAGYFNSIEEVGRAQVPYFISRDPIRAYKAPRFALISEGIDHLPSLITNGPLAKGMDGKGGGNYEAITMEAGSLFRFIGLYEDISSFIHATTKRKAYSVRSRKPIQIEHGPRYAKCVSFASHPSGEIVFIPVTETGRFYVMAKRSNLPSYNHIYSFSALLRIVKLPVTVQLVIGPRPKNSPFFNDTDPYWSATTDKYDSKILLGTNFSAVLRLEEVQVRDVILGCTLRPQPFFPIDNTSNNNSIKNFSLRRTWRSRNQIKIEDKPVLLEFDLDSGFGIYRTFVEKNGTLSSRKIPELVIQRIAFCDKEADLWRRQIKLAHDIITKENRKRSSTLAPRKPVRKSVLNANFTDPQKSNIPIMNKNASITSRVSNTSNVSRLSRIIQKFWPNRNKTNTATPANASGRSIADTLDTVNDNSLDFDELEEDLNEEDEGFNSGSPRKLSDYHLYETLKPEEEEERESSPIKHFLSRKQTLDIIFTDINVDTDRYILSSQRQRCNQSPIEEPAYSTID
ncbi:imaginal disc development protein B4 isoform X2 [Brevipalpus obovatus]|uniref:imaginal disc development protein B4 isoform X2 n=1 Tax=Brevipalpus obovatus TaxID=246614 RepID=UPI003D9FAA3D